MTTAFESPVALAGLVAGGGLAWTVAYGFAVRFGLDPGGLRADRAALAAGGGAGATVALVVAAVAGTWALELLSGLPVSPWLSLWVLAGPAGIGLAGAYHDRVGGDPSQWLGVGALVGFVAWPLCAFFLAGAATALA